MEVALKNALGSHMTGKETDQVVVLPLSCGALLIFLKSSRVVQTRRGASIQN